MVKKPMATAMATAMSITAIPILGRIFMELGVSHTRTAALTIAAAAFDDIVGWLLLGTVSAIVASHPESASGENRRSTR